MRRKKTFSDRSLVGVGLLFVLAGLPWLVWASWILMAELDSKGWVEVPAIIDHVHMRQGRTAKGAATYQVIAEYRYQFEGQWYHSDQVSVDGDDGTYLHDEKERRLRILDRHRMQGEPYPALVNPEVPSESILFPAWGSIISTAAMGAIFFLFGSAGIAVDQVSRFQLKRQFKLMTVSVTERWRHDGFAEHGTQRSSCMRAIGHAALKFLVIGVAVGLFYVVCLMIVSRFILNIFVLIIAAWMVRETIRQVIPALRQVRSKIDFDLPYYLTGQNLRGRLFLQSPLANMHQARLVLTLTKYFWVTKSYAREESACIWQEEKPIMPGSSEADPAAQVVCVDFDIPPDQPGRGSVDAERYCWRLEVVVGTDSNRNFSFILPIYAAQPPQAMVN